MKEVFEKLFYAPNFDDSFYLEEKKTFDVFISFIFEPITHTNSIALNL